MIIDKKNIVFYLFLVNTILYASYILIVSTSTGPPGADTGKEVTPYFNLIAHYIIYFGFSYFLFITFNELKAKVIQPRIYTIIFASNYGLIIELVQYHLPFRHFSWLDASINVLGAISFVILTFILRKFPNNKINELFM